ncbi:MAG: transporter substrate-binding domain-containing protein [Candidatus Omnitrophica bacterium]|nr:transporter substrate-binding domain-containing protein [Candidatus Omnitrophota bacterium]
MKKILFFLALILFAANLYAADTLIPVKVGIYEDAPLVFTGPDKNPQGICVDLLDKIAQKEGWKIEYLYGSWPECLERLKSGQIDLLVDIIYTDERSKLYDFTKESFISDWGEAYATRESGVRSILDIKDKIVAGVSNDMFYLEFRKLTKAFNIKCKFIEAGDYPGVFRMLEEGKADIGVVGRLYGARYGQGHGIERTAIVFSPQDSLVAAQKGKNQELLEAIDRDISLMKEDKNSYYYRVIDKWLGNAKARRFLSFLFWFSVSALGLLLLFISLSVILKTQVARRTRDLTAAYAKLKETQEQLIQAAKMQVVGGLASGVAHEVKNPLTIIIQGVEYLERKIPPDANIRMVFGNIKNAVGRADSIIRGLLDFSRVSKLEMTHEDVNLLCERCLALMKHQFDKERIRLVKELQPGIPGITVDKNKIEQVVINLLMNALQASSEEGRIILRTRFEEEEGEIIIEVEDSGSGISPEALNKLFDPFFTTKRGKGGTGLGLSVVKNIVEMHNGKIQIRNNDSGKGAVAIVTFKA